MTTEVPSRNQFSTDEQRWNALVSRDTAADGAFVYSVKTTGVYCRPVCPARLARRENIQFHATAAGAQGKGFRPCKRCRPDAASFIQHHRIAVTKACALIEDSIDAPDLSTLAASAGMSPSHLHRIFRALTGLTPKAYTVAHRSQRARRELTDSKTVTAAIFSSGFNSSARFYSNTSKVLGMTPTAFRAGGAGETLRFALGECSLGHLLVAASDVGICDISLGDDAPELLLGFQKRFPHAALVGDDKNFESTVAQVIAFVEHPAAGLNLPLAIQGTAFQQRVWKLLREIPSGHTSTYTQLAMRLGKPKSVRAVANACAANTIAIAIPCHRVIRKDGSLSGYRWGVDRKAALLARERRTK